ncbi:hypothetical protein Salat_2160600 [Sesamum alatum]|uniref:Uncharacterized protein n=1 Tax=Sesamum alatum TaxID=300844 RepID=A0AAE1Y1J7_9LAMI|nr:hypothetical protein Salat_2160600 [Sesamum alatum]
MDASNGGTKRQGGVDLQLGDNKALQVVGGTSLAPPACRQEEEDEKPTRFSSVVLRIPLQGGRCPSRWTGYNNLSQWTFENISRGSLRPIWRSRLMYGSQSLPLGRLGRICCMTTALEGEWRFPTGGNLWIGFNRDS